MAAWYCGSVEWAAVTPWAAAQAVSVGAIRRQLAAPTVGNERVWRCTTPGTTGASEPAWTLTKGSTTSDNGVVWTEITGNATYNWSAPHARLANAAAWMAAGDDCYIAADHAETQATSISPNLPNGLGNLCRFICVNQAGSVPPVSADLRTTASITTTGAANIVYNCGYGAYFYGLNFYGGSGANTTSVQLNGNKVIAERCSLNVPSTGSSNVGVGNSSSLSLELYNSTVSFGSTGAYIDALFGFVWHGPLSGITGSIVPSNLIQTGASALVDGVDLSKVTTQIGVGAITLVNCKLAPGVTPLTSSNPSNTSSGQVINSDSSATGNRQERYQYFGAQTTDDVVVRSGGASDGVQPMSWKVVTPSTASPNTYFEAFEIAVWVQPVGAARTATIELITDGVQLTNKDVQVECRYLANASTPLAGLLKTAPADPLAAATNLATSVASWATTGLTTPMPQNITLSFTPQMSGLVRFKIRVTKPSLTVRIDPEVTIA